MSDERKLAKFIDLGMVDPTTDEKTIAPAAIVAMVFANPVQMDRAIEFNREVPLDKPLNMDISAHGVGVMNKVTPELLLAVVANIIANAPNARVAVAQLRNEVMTWTFERSDGTRE